MVTEDELRARFGPYGAIERVNLLPQKNCAFINFVVRPCCFYSKEIVFVGDFSFASNWKAP